MEPEEIKRLPCKSENNAFRIDKAVQGTAQSSKWPSQQAIASLSSYRRNRLRRGSSARPKRAKSSVVGSGTGLPSPKDERSTMPTDVRQA
ncbi:MAG: hypothetical protein CBB70_12780, partial [Planctomycetaceae bacterium TMED10]